MDGYVHQCDEESSAFSSRLISQARSPSLTPKPDAMSSNLEFYHHFVMVTAVRLFREDHIIFWRDTVAELAWNFDFVREAVTSLGAAHRAHLLYSSGDARSEIKRLQVIGYRSYSKALRSLGEYMYHINKDSSSIILTAIMLMTYFESIMNRPRAALLHLWAAERLLNTIESEAGLENTEALRPLRDEVLRLDFLAQSIVPYGKSSFFNITNSASEVGPSECWPIARPWKPPSLEDIHSVSDERRNLLYLISQQNNINAVVWGAWDKVSCRPSTASLLHFKEGLEYWLATSPATCQSCLDKTAMNHTFKELTLENSPIPPTPLLFESSEAALSVALYYNYMSCTLWMLAETTGDEHYESMAFPLVYQNLRIAEGLRSLRGREKLSAVKGCEHDSSDHIDMNMTLFLFLGARRCYCDRWQKWTISALHSIGRHGLFDGCAFANAVEILCQLQTRAELEVCDQSLSQGRLGWLRTRIIPLLMPASDNGKHIAFYFQRHDTIKDGIHIVAQATWEQNISGKISVLSLKYFGESDHDDSESQRLVGSINTHFPWRESLKNGWHNYLNISDPS
ncbi:hypothetical protein F5884DRAFT_750700 [Xylogone sp. PMI_703]|nr:hypothetical protein F5884DRAFT_750700 [Xylogone sp. PMI_703]